MCTTMEAETFDFSRFGEGVESDVGEAYEMETFKTISGDAEDNERLTTSYDTTHLTGDALSEMQERHLKDAVDTWVRTIKKAYQYTGTAGLRSTTLNSATAAYTSETGRSSSQMARLGGIRRSRN
jgi:hypothetical protein